MWLWELANLEGISSFLLIIRVLHPFIPTFPSNFSLSDFYFFLIEFISFCLWVDTLLILDFSVCMDPQVLCYSFTFKPHIRAVEQIEEEQMGSGHFMRKSQELRDVGGRKEWINIHFSRISYWEYTEWKRIGELRWVSPKNKCWFSDS